MTDLLNAAEENDKLKTLAENIRSSKPCDVQIVGHAKKDTPADKNLANERATKIREILVAKDVPKEKLSIGENLNSDIKGVTFLFYEPQ